MESSAERVTGCSQILRKAAAWMKNLAKSGCGHIVIVHDLDRDPLSKQLRDLAKLRTSLESIAYPSGVERIVVIPVEEIEAWFWADDKIVKREGRGQGKAVASPETLRQPKEQLSRLSRNAGNKPRYSTNDNPSLAQELDLALCAERCRSFAELYSFLASLDNAPGG